MFNVMIVNQTKGYVGSKVLEVSAEGDVAVFYSDWLGFFKVIIQGCLSFPPLPYSILTLAVGLGEHVIAVGKFIVGVTSI